MSHAHNSVMQSTVQSTNLYNIPIFARMHFVVECVFSPSATETNNTYDRIRNANAKGDVNMKRKWFLCAHANRPNTSQITTFVRRRCVFLCARRTRTDKHHRLRRHRRSHHLFVAPLVGARKWIVVDTFRGAIPFDADRRDNLAPESSSFLVLANGICGFCVCVEKSHDETTKGRTWGCERHNNDDWN